MKHTYAHTHTHTVLYLFAQLFSLSVHSHVCTYTPMHMLIRIHSHSHIQWILPRMQSLMNLPQSYIKLANQGELVCASVCLRMCMCILYLWQRLCRAGSILPQTKASLLNWAVVDWYPASSLALDLVWGLGRRLAGRAGLRCGLSLAYALTST